MCSDDDELKDSDHNLPRGRRGRFRGDGDKGPARRASGEGVGITVDDEFVGPAGSFSSSDSDDLTTEVNRLVCVCVFIKLRIILQSGPVVLIVLLIQ